MARFALKTTAQVFVDLPNITTNIGAPEDTLAPAALCQYIERNLVGLNKVTNYTVYGNFTPNNKALRAKFARSSIKGRAANIMQHRRHKDVDQSIISDLWLEVVRAYKKLRPMVRHILVSGDADFLQAYEGISGVLGSDIEIELMILSWKERCSTFWTPHARQVHYLDDIPGIWTNECVN